MIRHRPPATSIRSPATSHVLRGWLSGHVIFVALAIECLVLGVATDAFLTPDNLSNVLRQLFGAFATSLFASMLLDRIKFHEAILAQTVTPLNTAAVQILTAAKSWPACVSHN